MGTLQIARKPQLNGSVWFDFEKYLNRLTRYEKLTVACTSIQVIQIKTVLNRTGGISSGKQPNKTALVRLKMVSENALRL